MKEKPASPLAFRPSAPPEEPSPASPASPPSVQASKASLVYSTKDDELYDPFSLRPSGVQYSDFGAWAHMVKGGMGTGIMSMPMAFKYGGLVLGLVGTPLVGLLSGHCVLMLVSTAQHLYVRARVPAMTMDQVAYYAFKCGPKRLRPYASAARSFVWAALFTTYFCVLISYSIFIGAAIQQLVEQWTEKDVLNTRVYIGLLALPLVPLGQVRQLRTLVPCSVTANLCVVVGFAITIYYLVDRAPDMENVNLSPSLIGVPIFFSTALYSMEGIGSVMPVENTMRNPGRLGGWNGVAARAILFIVMLFTVIGLLGYLRFGPAVMGSITLNLDQALVPAQVVKALLVVAITFTYPLQFYVLCELFEPMLEKRISSATLLSLAKSGMRVALVALSLLIAVAVPNLELAIALIGAVLFSTVGLLIPAGVHLVSELTLIADGEPGRWRALTVAKDAVLITLSLLVACAGVYSALADQDQDGDGRKA